MDKTIIVINAEIQEEGKIIPSSPATQTMVNSLKPIIKNQGMTLEIIAAASLWSQPLPPQEKTTIYCPLTIELPPFFVFPGQKIFQQCKEIETLRQWVKNKLGYQIKSPESTREDFWLPIILNKKGPVYGEVIAEGAIPNSYEQPINLKDQERQPLYHLAYQLLNHLNAPNAVYLLQFNRDQGKIIFDRLWPFPAAPALASLRVQKPDLYTCHWYCLTNQPIPEILVKNC